MQVPRHPCRVVPQGWEASQLARWKRALRLHPFPRPQLINVAKHRRGKPELAGRLRFLLSSRFAHLSADLFQLAGIEPVAAAAGTLINLDAPFRAEMAALPDWADTLVVSHWGFILSMTGTSMANGTWIRCDPTSPAPAELTWRH